MTYKVTLGHTPNPDVAGGYWEEPVDPRKARTVKVATIAEACAFCRAYIERNHFLGDHQEQQAINQSKQLAIVCCCGQLAGCDSLAEIFALRMSEEGVAKEVQS